MEPSRCGRPITNLSVDGYHRLNELTDRFRDLLKTTVLKHSVGSDQETRLVAAAKQICESDWLDQFEARNEQPRKAA